MKFAWIAEPPFNFQANGQLTGCDVELAKHAFAWLDETFEPVKADFPDLLPGLRTEFWDVTTGMFVTKEREQTAFFTRPIWSLRDGLLVKSNNLGKYKSYRDLAAAGEKVAVLKDQVQYLTAISNGIAAERIVVFRDYGEAAQAVAAGLVAAYASVEMAHRAHIASGAGDLACIVVPIEEKAPENGAFACRTSEIRDRLDAFIGKFVNSDEHTDMLRKLNLDPAQLLPI